MRRRGALRQGRLGAAESIIDGIFYASADPVGMADPSGRKGGYIEGSAGACYGYDALDRLVDATVKTGTGTGVDTSGGWAGASTIARYAYDLDPAGNIEQLAVSGSGVTAKSTNFAYNTDNQLCWRSPTSGAAVPAGPCGANRQTQFDANGNELTGPAGSGRTATYNRLDQTVSFTVNGATTPLEYLGAGQDRWTSEGSATFQHNVLGLGSRTSGGASTYFTRDEGGALVSRRSGSTRHYYLTDALGSVAALTNSSGVVSERYEYDPYGAPAPNGSGQWAAGSTDVGTGQFGFAAGYRSVGGLYHFGQRFYDPAAMRWTQPDPLDQTGDLLEGNRYAYVGANPVNNTDPSGKFLICGVVKACREAVKPVVKKAAPVVSKVVYPANTVACFGRKSILDDKDTEGWGDAAADGINCANPISGVTGDVPGGDK